MRRTWLALMMMVAVGCKGSTEIMFGFATDLHAKGQIDKVAFKVFDAQSGVIQVEPVPWDLADVPAGLYELPGSFGVYTDGSEPSLKVELTGLLQNQVIVRREAVLSPVSGKTLFMRLTLVAECGVGTGLSCPTGQTCIEGVCRAPEMASQRLPKFVKELVSQVECDSGTHFIKSSTGEPLQAIGGCAAGEFCQEGTCYARLPEDGMAIGPSSWMPQPTSVSTTTHGAFASLSGDIFVVGDHGLILHFAGGSPTDETFDATHALWGVWGSPGGEVFAVGGDGAILHRTAAGWAAEAAPPAAWLGGVWGAGGDVWAVGRLTPGAPAILHRTGGQWVSEDAGVAGAELRGVWASSAKDVWAVGPAMLILHNDGTGWQSAAVAGGGAPGGPQKMDASAPDLLAVGGSGPDDVYFVGRGGTILHRGSDGQIVAQKSPKPFDLYAVWANAANDVYAVGDYGLILHSTGDGTWAVQESGTREPLFTVRGTSTDNVFAAGRLGTLLHFGGGRRGKGQACAMTPDCVDALTCADGFCCERACDGACEACNLAGQQGSCLPVAAGQPIAHGDKMPAKCISSDVSQDAATCDGAGKVRPTTTTTCDPYLCGASTGTCFAQCDDPSQCVSTLNEQKVTCENHRCGLADFSLCDTAKPSVCASNACISNSQQDWCCPMACPVTCKDTKTQLGICHSPDGGVCNPTFAVSCGNYTCVPNSGCKHSCACSPGKASCTSADCSAGSCINADPTTGLGGECFVPTPG